MRIRTTGAVLLSLALLPISGCGEDETQGAAPRGPLQGELSLELRDSAAINITGSGDATSVSLTASAGFGLLPANAPLTGEGRTEALAEASSTLYTAKLEAPAQADGPCGAEPVSLALSLHRPGQSAMVVGGLSAYCGAGVWYGTPVRVLRLAGELR